MKKKAIKETLGFTCLFISAFDPQVFFLPKGVGFTLLLSFFLMPLLLIGLKDNKYNSVYFLRRSLPYLLAFFLSFLIIIFRIVLNEGLNLIFILSWFKALFVFLACLSTYIIFYAARSTKYFIYSVISIYTLNGIINFVAATYPESFGFVKIFQSSETHLQPEVRNLYRESFISSSNYYSIGTAYGLITLLVAYYISKNNVKNIILPFLLSFISLTGFIAARTAFFGIISSYIYIFRKKLLYSVILAITGSVFTYIAFSLPSVEPYKNWMLEFFELANSASGSHLISDMYFWPGDKIFLAGMGAVNDGTFIYTDSGYMQDILFGGLLFLFVKLSFLFILVFSFIRKNLLFVILFSFTVLVFHFKGSFLYNNAQGMAALYFIYFYLIALEFKDQGLYNNYHS